MNYRLSLITDMEVSTGTQFSVVNFSTFQDHKFLFPGLSRKRDNLVFKTEFEQYQGFCEL